MYRITLYNEEGRSITYEDIPDPVEALAFLLGCRKMALVGNLKWTVDIWHI
jgi:hypothetical protein